MLATLSPANPEAASCGRRQLAAGAKPHARSHTDTAARDLGEAPTKPSQAKSSQGQVVGLAGAN